LQRSHKLPDWILGEALPTCGREGQKEERKGKEGTEENNPEINF